MSSRTETTTRATELVARVDELRRAEAQFGRRLAAVRAPNDTDREAMRYILDAPDDAPATPGGPRTAIVKHIQLQIIKQAQPHTDLSLIHI